MAKTNFTKAENALDEGLRKISVSNLCRLADIAAQIGPPSESSPTKTQRLLIQHLKIDLLRLKKKDNKIYSKLHIKKETLNQQFAHPESLSPEEWQALEALRTQTKALIAEYYPNESNDELIAQEKNKHRNKRFNVKDTWLPLQ